MLKKRTRKKVKVSLKIENKILTEMCKYLFGIASTTREMHLYYISKVERLEKQLEKRKKGGKK